MDKYSMLEEIILYYAKGNKALLSRMLGVKPQTINTWLNRNTFDADHFYDLRHNSPHLWLGISLVRELCLFSWVLGWLRCSILGVYVALM